MKTRVWKSMDDDGNWVVSSVHRYYSPERRKVRGLKKVRNTIQKWKEEQLAWLDSFEDRDFDDDFVFARIRLYPWCSYKSMQEPGWVRREISSGLTEIYRKWHTMAEATGVPYYLKILVSEPFMDDPQVVAAFGTSIDFYNKNFFVLPADKNFPYQSPAFEGFSWEYCQLHPDCGFLDEEPSFGWLGTWSGK